MAKPLAPRVEGPISVLNSAVTVTGLALGAEAVVYADGGAVGRDAVAANSGVLDPGGLTAAVVALGGPLHAGQQVTARQVVAGETSDPSPAAVTVVGIPPSLPPPVLATFPFAGVEIVSVRHLFPGATLDVSLAGGGAAAATSVPVTAWDMAVRLARPVAAGDRLTLTLRGAGNPINSTTPDGSLYYGGSREVRLPAPVFLLPPRECDRGIRIGGIVPGAEVTVTVDADVQKLVVAGTTAYVRVGRLGPGGIFQDAGLRQGADVTVSQSFPSTGQRTDPNHPLHGIAGGVGPSIEAPSLVGAVCPSATTLVVTGYRPGAEIHVYIDPVADNHWAEKAEWAHRAPIGETDEIPVAGLGDGALVAVTQEPCPGHQSGRSTPVKVSQPGLAAPFIELPVLECSQGVTAANLSLGADVAVWSKTLGGPVGPSYRALVLSTFIEALLIADDDVQLVETGCVDPAHHASAWQHVEPAQPDKPSIDYAYVGDTAVAVFGTVGGGGKPAVGALVDVFVGPQGAKGTWRGRGRLNAGGGCWVPLAYGSLGPPDFITVLATLCGDPVASDQIPVSPIVPPLAPTLTNPKDGDQVGDVGQWFTWVDPGAGTPREAVSYLFTLARIDGGQFTILADHWAASDVGVDWSPTMPRPLEAGKQYRYWVAGQARRGKPGPEASAQFEVKAAAKPPAAPATPRAPSWSKLEVFNCNNNLVEGDPAHRHLYIWSRDLDAHEAWQGHGDLPPQYDADGSCGPGFSASPLELPLVDGHWTQLVCVDPDLAGCGGNDPDEIGCRRYDVTFLGSKGGSPLAVVVS